MSRKHQQHAAFKITDADLPLIDALSAPYKRILLLSNTIKDYAGLAVSLNCAVGTAKSRLHRARTALAAARPAA